MQTDALFYQLLKRLPDTIFALVGQPLSSAADYRFDALEIKKSYRLDGLLVPNRSNLPVYFVEVQFRRMRRFYANLFAKVFSYLEANDPDQDWMAVALFSSRGTEPKRRGPYEDLLASSRVRRIYLDELSIAGDAPPGLTILKLATAGRNEAVGLASHLLQRARLG
jgi:predicted transposase YdaD